MLTHTVVSNSVTPRTVACQAPLSVRFPRQEYWNGLPFPPPGDLPDPRIKPVSPASPALEGRFLTTEPLGSPYLVIEEELRVVEEFLKRKMNAFNYIKIDNFFMPVHN